MQLDEQRIQRRRELLRFGREDVRRLARLAPLIRLHVDELTDSFFRYLADFPEADQLLKDAAALREARRLKREHLLAMFEGFYGFRYAEQRVQLASVYGRAGLDHHAFLGAFHHLMSRIAAQIGQERAGRGDDPLLAVESLRKLALFDIGLILDALTFERQRVILEQQKEIRALSTPVLKLRDRLLLLPLIGIVDAERAGQLTEQLLHAIQENRAKVVVLDITGTASVDSLAANGLVQAISKARVMGSEVIVTGVSAEMAQRLVHLGVDLARISTVGDLQGGIERAERLLTTPPRASSAARRERSNTDGGHGDALRQGNGAR